MPVRKGDHYNIMKGDIRKMRKVRILAAVIVTMLILTLSVSAARFTLADAISFRGTPRSPYTVGGYGDVSSPTSTGGYGYGGGAGFGLGGTPYTPTPRATGTLNIHYWANVGSAPLTAQVLLRSANSDLTNYSFADLVTDFDKVWKRKTGAPAENAAVATLANVSVDGPIDDVYHGGDTVSFSLDVPGLAAGDPVLVIHKAYGAWLVEENVSTADGKVSVTTKNGLDCFAVLVDNGAAPAAASSVSVNAEAPAIEAYVAPVDAAPVVAEAPTSPQTGINVANVAVAAAVVMAALGSACIVKANRRHDA